MYIKRLYNSMEHIPKISVVMPVWNGEKYIREAIDSILNQTYGDFEFIIIDDGSTDQTIEIIDSYDDSRIRLFKRDHEGIVSALNFGVGQARAEWIARQDADDVSLPERFKRQMRLLKNSEAVLCYGACEMIGTPSGGRTPYVARTKALLSLQMCIRCPIVHTSVLFSKTTFLKAGGYLEEERHAEDFGLWGRMLKQGNTIGIRQPIVLFREHAESISKQKADVQAAIAEKLCVQHCQQFCGLDAASGADTAAGLKSTEPTVWLKSCLKFIRQAKLFNFELGAWCLSQTLRRGFK